jgi:glyoxylase-like metal-dependent hydrolase (beta-lactamase superfamily II)
MMTLTSIPRKAVLAIALLLLNPVCAQDEDEITIQRLSDTVSVLIGDGNIGVFAGPDGVFIIDDQIAGVGEKIAKAVASISDQPIDYVLNTHWHFDHAGSNDYFGNAGSVIVAHDNVRKRLESGGYLSSVDYNVPPAPAEALPIITFNDTISWHLNGEEIQFIHLAPAHTDGDGIVWFKDSNIVHMGDTFLAGILPSIDVDSGGTIEGSLTTVNAVLTFIDDNTQIIPGHGPVTNKAELEAWRDMFVVFRDRVVDMKNRGMSLEEVITADPTTDLDDRWNSWGDNFKKRSIGEIYKATP